MHNKRRTPRGNKTHFSSNNPEIGGPQKGLPLDLVKGHGGKNISVVASKKNAFSAGTVIHFSNTIVQCRHGGTIVFTVVIFFWSKGVESIPM